jgi:hypothetical protein
MAIIHQPQLFSWDEVEAQSDLHRLRMVVEALPDETLMQTLEAERKGRRDDYPLRAVWNSLLAGLVFQHPTIESLRRELCRNAELRQVCGFDVFRGAAAVPPPWVYTRLLSKLLNHPDLVEAMFEKLVACLQTELVDLGTRLAVDSKAIGTFGRKPSEDKYGRQDGRRDTDADWGTKTYKGVREDGSVWEKVKRWFGYKVHLLVDADYELPLAYTVTRASANDSPELPKLLQHLDQTHPELLERAKHLSGDKAYDAADHNEELWETYRIKPVIDVRNCWQEQPHQPRQLFPDRVDTVFYTAQGHVLCRCRDLPGANGKPDPLTNYEPMAYQGFEADRGCLKFRCPAAARGVQCSQRDLCNQGCHTRHGRVVRVPLDYDRRLFTPLARGTKAWQREYNKRTSVERVNSRIDGSFGFERHTIRGLKKMRFRVGLALTVMLALALSAVQAGRHKQMRSLVKPRAA